MKLSIALCKSYHLYCCPHPQNHSHAALPFCRIPAEKEEGCWPEPKNLMELSEKCTRLTPPACTTIVVLHRPVVSFLFLLCIAANHDCTSAPALFQLSAYSSWLHLNLLGFYNPPDVHYGINFPHRSNNSRNHPSS